ncbi:hypothetical protein LBMAG56_21100 [Verrucomicrobiota bacterium]|nr:hypothetical protein LBMAG56_21100 [Verrucomicrobiota bacterium]
MLLVLLFVSLLRAAEPTPPPLPPAPLKVTVAPADAYPRVKSKYAGFDVDPVTQAVRAASREEEAVLFPRCGGPLEFQFTVTANGADRTVKFTGAITDYFGAELQKVAANVTAKDGATATKNISVTPTEKHFGPFYLNGTWVEVGGANKGEFSLTAGQANWRLVIEDFESVKYPEPGAPLENSPAAKHRGQRGLIVRWPAEATPPPTPAPGKKPTLSNRSLPLDIVLAARPVKLGLWVKSAADAQITARLRDPGVDAQQRNNPDTWTVGPVEVPAGDWRYVEIPMPGFSRPQSLRKSANEPNGIVDYPLTLQSLELSAAPGSELFLDDLELWTQGERDGSLQVRAATDKPVGLLYRNDTLNLVLANAWLWGGPVKLAGTAALEDINGGKFPLPSPNATIDPGGEFVLAAPLTNLPIGPWKLTAAIEAATGETLKVPDSAAFLVYEPSGRPLPQVELHKILRDRNRLLVDLGFANDTVVVPWHSVDGSPSVEAFPGHWTFDFITPAITTRRAAGIEVFGLLGFTALWADPSGTYDRKLGVWIGSTYVMPSRPIYWEQYVHRTVEQFTNEISTWVVWDRPDSEAFKATPREYTEQMLAVAHRAALEANPRARLVSGGVTRENFGPFLTGLAEAGAGRYLHGIGILPSTSPLSPEDGYMDVELARAQRIRRQEHLDPELWVLNLGWSSGEGQERVSEFTQAFYLPRAYVICRSQGIGKIFLQPDMTETVSKRDSADLIYPDGDWRGIKPAALSARTVRTLLNGAQFIREIFLNDRRDGLARAYLFRQADGKLLLAAWRREGSSVLPLTVKPDAVLDTFGNPLASSADITLRPAPLYATFSGIEIGALVKQLERAPLRYDDAPESAWKREWTFYLDVGDPADEQAANYSAPGSQLVGPIDSHYHTEYGRHVEDSGRHFKGKEKFTVDVASFGAADLMLRKRINFNVPNQMVDVYCNGQFVGPWLAFKRDRRYRWRDIEFIVPNKFFAGRPKAEMRFVTTGDSEATSYYYWAGPLRTKTVYVSDLSLLVGTSGYGAGVNRDKNILGGGLKFFQKTGPGEPFAKGIGTHSAAAMTDSLVVVCANKQFKRLRATVGVDAATNGRGSVRFRVGDGVKTLWDSQDMTYYTPAKEVDLDISDAILLMLWVDDTGDGTKDDIANWAGLRLELK